jgi:hypothetical protein
MKRKDYQEELEGLRRAGLTMLEVNGLYQFRRAYVENGMDRSPVDLSHPQFIRWIVVKGSVSRKADGFSLS